MRMSRSTPPDSASPRGDARPVRRRTRTFRPNYLSFAGTYQCNLSCAHCCVPIEWPDRLDIATALRFLEDAHTQGIGILGFTGGEPFLYPEFLHKLWRYREAMKEVTMADTLEQLTEAVLQSPDDDAGLRSMRSSG